MKNPAIHSSGLLKSATSPESLNSKIRKAFSRGRQALFVMLLSVSLLLQSQSLIAQAPQQFSFQGVARDATGKIISNTTIAYSFKIHQGAADGTVVYQNEGLATTNSSGVFNTTVGTTGSPLPSSIQWGADKFFLQVGIDPDGTGGSGIFFTDLGATQLITVPYAMYSSESGKWRDNAPIVQKGDLSLPLASLPNIGFGPTLIWHPKKAAFRAGYAAINDWEEGGIGSFSFAAGYGPKATGLYSVSAGNSSQALAESAIALGDNTIANAANSVAVGKNSSATGTHAVSIGQGTLSGGANALAMGLNSTASGNNSIAIGTSTTASQSGSVAVGSNAYAPGLGAISIGHYTTASASYSIALGRFNQNGDVPNGSLTDRLFQIGNGTSVNQRSNALTILKNGNVGIGANVTNPEHLVDIDGRIRIRHNGNTAGLWLGSEDGNSNNSIFIGAQGNNGNSAGFFFPGVGWSVWFGAGGNGHFAQEVYAQEFIENSDRNLKTNLKGLNNSLNYLHSISGYTYNWKKGDTRKHVGVIAQEVEKNFPELVYTKGDGFKAVRYTGLIPHLIEAVKELDKKTEEITALKKELASMQELNKKLSALEANVKMLLAGQAETTSQTGK